MARDPQAMRPDAITTPRRRGLLAGTIAALLTGTAAVAMAKAPLPGDDAELMRLCADFRRLTAAMAAWPPEDDDGFDTKMSERWAVSDRIMLLSAATDTGRRQKAAVALVGLERRPHAVADTVPRVVLTPGTTSSQQSNAAVWTSLVRRAG